MEPNPTQYPQMVAGDIPQEEILAGRTTLVEFTPPLGNVTEGTDLPAQLVVSIEKGLGNVTSLQQYTEAGDKILGSLVANFTVTSQPSFLSGGTCNIEDYNCKRSRIWN
jgi:hypothetical protein